MANQIRRLLSPTAPMRLGGMTEEPYNRQMQELLAYAKQLLASKDFSILSDEDLKLLDPALHSLSYLFVLHLQIIAAQTKSKKKIPKELLPGGQLWFSAVLFLRNFDPVQVRYAGHEWRSLVTLVEDAAEADSQPFLAVKPIKDGMLRLDPSCSVLTSTHVRFTKLCLRSRAFYHAVPVLEKHICHFAADSGRPDSEQFLCTEHKASVAFITEQRGFSAKLSTRDYLEYFLYGAMIYMGLERWSDAMHFLNIVISAPTVNSVSLVMVEAYKKRILVSLLEHGKVVPLPGLASTHTSKVLSSLSSPYAALAEAFEARDSKRLKAEVEVGQPVWQKDNNTGLVFQVVEVLRRFAIIDLGRTFAALSMTDVADRGLTWANGAEEAESVIASMIASESLNATLSQKTSEADPTMLRFAAEPVQPRAWREASVQSQMIAERRVLKNLLDNIEQSDHYLELSGEYMESLQRSQKQGENSGKESYRRGDEAEQFYFDEEDIMEDS